MSVSTKPKTKAMKSIVLAASLVVLSLTACNRHSGPARGEALERISELSSASASFSLMVETGWQEPDPVKTAEYQDTLARLELARADARTADATPKDIKEAEAKGTAEAGRNHDYLTKDSESPRDRKERIAREMEDAKAAVELEALKIETARTIRAGENAEKIRAWENSRR